MPSLPAIANQSSFGLTAIAMICPFRPVNDSCLSGGWSPSLQSEAESPEPIASQRPSTVNPPERLTCPLPPGRLNGSLLVLGTQRVRSQRRMPSSGSAATSQRPLGSVREKETTLTDSEGTNTRGS